MKNDYSQIKNSDIAIIGMSCRFPDANNIAEFWNNLQSGKESIRFFSDEELPLSKQDISKKDNYIKAGATLSNVDEFDAEFFGYSEREASIIDPQQRLLLECAYEAIEDAGYNSRNYKKSIGVFAGGGLSTYFINNVHPHIGFHDDRTFLETINDLQLMIGNDKDYITTRISYKLDLRGPSVNVQSACSTSLVAVHLACQSIINGECDMALAGAVNIQTPQNTGYLFEEDMVYSSDGHCRAFDASADGIVFGNGVGIILLKSLREAIIDGDDIYAVIIGSAINNDGGLKVGYTAPSVNGQASVIAEAIAVSGVSAETITYVETHGTATKLGDPIEIAALTKAFQQTTSKLNYCAIGSVKTNIGHLSWAAGMAGLIKTVLSLKNKKIPPSLNFKKPNPHIDFLKTPFYVNSSLQNWERINFPRRAGVSAFGIGGTNAHLILEEAFENSTVKLKHQEQSNLFTLSANDSNSLKQLAAKYYQYLDKHNDIDLANLCYTVNTGRQNYNIRLAATSSSIDELKVKLKNIIDDENLSFIESINNCHEPYLPIANETIQGEKKISFLFTGQGSQYPGMGKNLYESNEYFKNVIDECDQYLKSNFRIEIKNVLFNKNAGAIINDITYTQVAIFVFEYSLAKLWMSFGIQPDYVMGHSTGEYVAACIAGVFSLEDGLTLCFMRAKLMKELVSDDGMMASIQATVAETEQVTNLFNKSVSIAAINSPISTVISGKKSDIESACRRFETKNIKVKKLIIDRAGHCNLMNTMLNKFEDVLNKIKFKPQQIKLVSNVTGKVASDKITFPKYWLSHTIQPVNFYSSLQTLSKEGVNVFLEIGAKPDLISMGVMCLPDGNHFWIPSIRPDLSQDTFNNDWEQIIFSIGKFYILGFPISWSNIFNYTQVQKLHLPTYSFQRKSYWVGELPIKSTSKTIGTNINKWKDWLFQTKWIERLNEKQNRISKQSETWLLFGEKNNIYDSISKKLFDLGNKVILVQQGNSYKKESENSFVVNPDKEKDFNLLFSALGFNTLNIILAWGMTSQFKIDSVNNYCNYMLWIIQRTLERKSDETKFVLISNKAQNLKGDLSEIGLLHSPLFGIMKVLQIENPDIKCKCIDLDINYEIDVNNIVEDLKHHYSDNFISYRNGKRFIQKLVKVKVNNSSDEENKIDLDATYLITGGMGGLGFLSAKWLIEKGVKSIVLVGRRKLSLDAIEKINSFNQNGRIVFYFNLDVSKKSDVKNLFNKIDNLTFPLKGIIHAAGILDDGVIQQLDKERFQKALQPKVNGSWNLHTETIERNYNLNFFLFFSSAVSVIGNGGQAIHAAANSFMDMLANYRINRGEPATSINWGAWSEVGELVNNDVANARLNRLGFGTISAKVGISFLDYLLSNQNSQIGVLPMDWSKFLSQGNLESITFFEECKSNDSQTKKNDSILKRMLEQPVENHSILLKDFVRKQALRILTFKKSAVQEIKIDDSKHLTSYGIDSLSSIELRNIIQFSLKIKLPPTFIFEYPSIDLITNYILSTFIFHQDNLTSNQNEELNKYNSDNYLLKNKLSVQQQRWLSLVKSGYGKRVVPILFAHDLNKTAFYDSLLIVVERHELLRYYFPDNKKEIKTITAVLPTENDLFLDLSSFSQNELPKLIGLETRKCLDEMPNPSLQPSWAIKCIKLSDRKFVALLSLQHLDFDGSSITNFVEELSEYYNAICNNKSLEKKLPVQYSKFIEWQSDYIANSISEDRAFFEGLYSTLQETTALQKHHGFTVTKPFESSRFTTVLENKFWFNIQNYASNLNVTPFSILLAAYSKIIAEITSSNDIVIAMITNGRTEREFKKIIGPFTVPFPVRVNVSNNSFAKLSIQCHKTISTINSRAYYPVTDLVKTISAFKGFPIDTYFSDVGINFTNYKKEEIENSGVKVLEILGPLSESELSEINTEELKRIPGLHLVINTTNNDNLNLNFWYHKHRFTEKQIISWSEKYIEILKFNLNE